MNYSFQTPRLLHDEHMEEVAVLEKLEGMLQRQKPSEPPASDDKDVSLMLSNLIACVDTQANQHFVFEEEHLFPRLAQHGEANIGQFLSSEHAAIREIGDLVLVTARDGRERGFDAQSWKDFHSRSQELIEWVIGHIQKEEMALLPMVEDMISEEDDAELAAAYMACR